MNTTNIETADATPSGEVESGPLADFTGGLGHTAVVGLQFGDEGKGQIVDLLTRRFDVVVRYNGGANAGHTVQIGDQKFALHLLPSGVLWPDKLNVVGNGLVVDPAQMLKEIDALRQRGIDVRPNLRVSDRAHVVFPYHKVQDAVLETALAHGRGETEKIGTTGRGIGPAYADKALRGTAVRMGELLDADRLREKLAHIVSVKNAILKALTDLCGEDAATGTPFDADALAEQYVQYGRRLAPMICDTSDLLLGKVEAGCKVLFEGANAVLLDVDHGTYPYVTSSHCSALGVYPGSGLPGGTVQHVVGICKLYTSRVGGGPFPTELHDATSQRIREVGGEYGTTTGRPRRCGWLDLVAIRYTSRLCGATSLACTGLSVLAGMENLKVCVGYRYRGEVLKDYPADARILDEVEPVLETMEGFPGPVDQCREFGELPPGARAYLQYVSSFVGVPVSLVCVGRRRDQILAPPSAHA